MPLIPFDPDEPLVYHDEETGIDYYLRQPTDEIDYKLIEINKKFPQEERVKLWSKDESKYREWLNDNLNAIFIKWVSNGKTKVPTMPADPASRMPVALRINLLKFFNDHKKFSGDDLKK